jgi:hypothetical protein
VPDAKYDAKALVFLLVQLLNFQEGALGKEVGEGSSVPHGISINLFHGQQAAG